MQFYLLCADAEHNLDGSAVSKVKTFNISSPKISSRNINNYAVMLEHKVLMF
jgi:hypothetical protein